MNRSRVTGDLASQGNIFVDIANDRVGIGSTIPTQKLEVTGTVKATAFVGSGANLTGIDTDLVSDTSPQLGGHLDVLNKEIITTTTNGNIKVRPNGTGFFEVFGDGSSSDGTIQLNCSQNSHGVKIKSPAHSAGASYTLTLPNSIVNNGFLKTDSSGNLSFAAADVVNDTSPQLGGNLASNGNNINIADSTDGSTNRITFGSGGDLQIYHDSSHSYIHDGGTGNLKVRSNNFRVSNADESKTSATFVPAGAVELYNNHSKKFETTSGGIDVTGTVTADNQIILNSGDSTPARIDLYCEVSNAHYTRLQAPAHSTYSGNVTVTIPNTSGNLAVLTNATNNNVVTATGTHAMTGESRLTFDGNSLDISGSGSHPFTPAGGDFRNLTITGNSANSSGFIYLGNGAATTNADFDLGRIRIHNGATEVALITGTTDTSANDDGRIELHTRNTGGSLQERLRIASDGQIKQTAASGDTIFTFKRSDTNTTGAVGVLNFAASDDHSVANMQVLGDGDNEGAHIVFKTTSAAASADPYNAATVERLRIKSNGQIILGSDGTNSELTFSQDGTSGVILNSTTTGFGGYNTFTVNSAAFVHKYGSNDRMTIDSSGRLLLGSSFSSNVNTFKYSIKESSNENAAILFLDSDNMRGGICGTTKGNDELITGTGNMDFVVGSLYSDTFIIGGQSGNQNGAIRMKISANTGHVLIGPNAASEHNCSGNLDIVGDNNSNGPELYLRVSNNNTTDNIGALLFGNNVDKSIVKIQGVTHTANNTGDIAFHTSTAGTMTEKLRVTSAGALGLNGTNYGTAGQVLTSQGSGQPVEWRTIVQAPVISSITGNIFAGSSGQTLTLAGQHFGSATGVVNFKQTSDGVDVNVNVTPSSDTALTVTIPSSVGNNVTAGNAVTVKFTNSAGLIGSGTNTTVLALPSGGSITTSGNFRIHTFTSSGNFVLTKSTSIEYLVVAGGGGGGGNDGGQDFSGGSGGGGAGGHRTGSVTPSASTHTITVGGGGSGNLNQFAGSNGSNSAFGSIVSTGGGGGGGVNNAGSNGQSGGSGGGAGGDDGSTVFTGGSGTSGQGNAGGQTGGSADAGGGGGGGAGGTGGNGVGHDGGAGGAGTASSITGSSVTRAGGGGGGVGAGTGNVASGGSGGGGSGACRSVANATAGSANTGGGGGGAADSNVSSEQDGKNGGSGIVILRYNVTNL